MLQGTFVSFDGVAQSYKLTFNTTFSILHMQEPHAIHHHILLHVNLSYLHAQKFLHYRHNSHWIHVCNTRGLSTCDVCLQADCGVFRYYEKVQALLQ